MESCSFVVYAEDEDRDVDIGDATGLQVPYKLLEVRNSRRQLVGKGFHRDNLDVTSSPRGLLSGWREVSPEAMLSPRSSRV